MSPPPPVPPELLAAVKRGDPEAIDGWYRAEHPFVYRLCFGFLAHVAEAEDTAQDAMLHLIDRLHGFDDSRAYPAWRNTVVLNLCRDRLRRRDSRLRAEERLPERALGQPLPRPEDVASAREIQDLIRQTLAALSPREREAFVLRDLEGVSTGDVAATLGISASSVRSLLTLARRRLRRLLGPSLPGLAAAPAGGPRDD